MQQNWNIKKALQKQFFFTLSSEQSLVYKRALVHSPVKLDLHYLEESKLAYTTSLRVPLVLYAKQ